MKVVESNGVYYAEAIDTDSKHVSWVKIWDTREIPAHIIAHCLADHLTPGHKGIRPAFEFKRRI